MRDDRELQLLARDVADAAATLEGLRASIHIRLRGVLWFGGEAQRVRDDWESEVGPALGEVAGVLRRLALLIGEDSEPHVIRGVTRGSPDAAPAAIDALWADDPKTVEHDSSA